MSDFKIYPARPIPGAGTNGSGPRFAISGQDGVVSRTPVAGRPDQEVIHGVYSEGTYVVMGPRQEPAKAKQSAWVAETEDETTEETATEVQRVGAKP